MLSVEIELALVEHLFLSDEALLGRLELALFLFVFARHLLGFFTAALFCLGNDLLGLLFGIEHHLTDLELHRSLFPEGNDEAEIVSDPNAYNAGYGEVGALEETPESELRAIMETNFFGAIAVIQAALPTLRAQRSGNIVNISSLGGQLSFEGFSAYSATKFALEGASEALAREVAPLGIKVLIVEPGSFRTELAGNAMRHMPIIDAYQDTVGGTRAFAHDMHRARQGDPHKAAAVIEQALQSERTPLRLQLGADAIDAVRSHAEAMLDDMRDWEAVSTATAFDD